MARSGRVRLFCFAYERTSCTYIIRGTCKTCLFRHSHLKYKAQMHALCTVYMLFSSRIGDIRRLRKVHAVGRKLVRPFMIGSPALYSSPVGDAVDGGRRRRHSPFIVIFHKQIRSSNCRNVRGRVRCWRSFSLIPTGLFLLFPPSALKKEGRGGRRKGERETASRRGGGGEIFSRPVEVARPS